ncbi:hypothetical protein [uncultured Desulfobacter sp.]|uniref:hypothetical protein n=1 Tax=uncultured Desulfobacter sp. TaxID=240139 RepID=UPI0029F4E405|nr:hypothetical protein [uncultured Desulfobacter sp.]
MDFPQLIGAIGIGAILTKILDIVWLQNSIEKKEHFAWLREKRIEAFSKLSKELISFGLHDKKLKNPFEIFAIASEAMLLIEDEVLIKKIDQHIVKLDEFNRGIDEKNFSEEQLGSLYSQLTAESRKLILELRLHLIEITRKRPILSKVNKSIKSLTKKFSRPKGPGR